MSTWMVNHNAEITKDSCHGPFFRHVDALSFLSTQFMRLLVHAAVFVDAVVDQCNLTWIL